MMLRKVASAALIAALLSSSALAQPVPGGGGSGGGGGGTGDVTGPGSSTSGNFPSFNGTGGKTLQDSTYSPSSFAPAGVVTVVTGSNPTTNAASWSAFTQYTIGGSGRTITLPASSGLSANGGLDIDANTNSVTLTATSPDTITWAGSTTGAGGSVTLPAGAIYRVSTDAAGKIYVSGRQAQGNGVKTQLSTGSTTTNNCVKFDANGNTVDAGAACGGTFTPILPNYIAGNTYIAQPYVGLATGPAFGNTNATWMPVMVNKTLTINAIGTKLQTADSGQNCQFAMYAADATTNKPTGSALATTANVSTTTGNTNISGSVSLQLTANTLYFMGAMCSGTTAAFEGFGITSDPLNGYLLGAGSFNGIGVTGGQIGLNYGTTGLTFGTWPTNPTVTLTSANGATVKNFVAMFTVASVP